MKRITIILLTVLMMLSFQGCGQTSDNQTDESVNGTIQSDIDETLDENIDEEIEESTIEDIMDQLVEEDDAYSKAADGYVWVNTEPDVTAEYTFKVSGNDVYMEGILDYGSDNKTMVKSFKDDPESIADIPADFLMEFASLANTEEATISYIMYVGSEKVAEEQISYKEALKISEDIDD